MTTNDLVTVRDKAEKAYEAINDIISSYGFEMLDLATLRKTECKTLTLSQR